ncbi:MAG TPA: hypothetical protein PLW09_13080 [Candidatus Kapabacteria bacterium]|nr:hypothetical protein [Candidatus Kapabacteria bacterium]
MKTFLCPCIQTYNFENLIGLQKPNHHQNFPSLRGGRHSLTGWMIFHKFYKRLIPTGFIRR